MFIKFLLYLLLKLGDPTHPVYVSVIDVLHNNKTQNVELTTKTYTDDLEFAIFKMYGMKVDLLNETKKKENNVYVEKYIRDHLQVIFNEKALSLNFVGFEKQEASIWVYFEAGNISSPQKVQIATNLLFEVSNKQNNIIHVTVNNNEKTTKLVYPENNASFDW